ncbi:MAG TPA: type II toxin-antitoxin system ParD family antitoxin [Xanthobacteraceae bacterium]
MNDERITITLTDEMAQAIRGAVQSGDYVSDSEVVREALRDWAETRLAQEHETEQLRSELLKGIADIQAGRVSDFSPENIVSLGERRLHRAGSE